MGAGAFIWQNLVRRLMSIRKKTKRVFAVYCFVGLRLEMCSTIAKLHRMWTGLCVSACAAPSTVCLAIERRYVGLFVNLSFMMMIRCIQSMFFGIAGCTRKDSGLKTFALG